MLFICTHKRTCTHKHRQACTHTHKHTHELAMYAFFDFYSQCFLGLVHFLQRWCSGAAGRSGWASSSTHVHFPVRLLPVRSTKVQATRPLPLLLYVLGDYFVRTNVQFNSTSTSSSDSYSIWSLTAATGPTTPQQAHTGAIELVHTYLTCSIIAYSLSCIFPCRNLLTMRTW